MSDDFKHIFIACIVSIILILIGLYLLFNTSNMQIFAVGSIFIGSIGIVITILEHKDRQENPENYTSSDEYTEKARIFVIKAKYRNPFIEKKETNPGKIFMIVGIIFILNGIFMELSTFSSIFTRIGFSIVGDKSLATVVSHNLNRTKNAVRGETITYSNILKFEHNGEEFTAEDTYLTSNPPSHHIGEVVKVTYNKYNPSDIMINGSLSTYISFILQILFYSIFIIIGKILFVKGNKERKKKINYKSS